MLMISDQQPGLKTLGRIAATLLFVSAFVLNSRANAAFPVAVRNSAEFSREAREIVDEKWENSSKRQMYNKVVNPQECRVLEDYARKVLAQLIIQSNLSATAADLYISMFCVTHESEDLDAELRGRTVTLHPSLFGMIKSEDAFAFVLAHELTHHIERYEEVRATLGLEYLRELSAEKQSEIETVKVDAEKRADLVGLRILANAGYSSLGAIEVAEYLERAYTAESSGHYVSVNGHADPTERRMLLTAEARKLGLSPTPRRPLPAPIKAASVHYKKFGLSRPGKPDRQKVL